MRCSTITCPASTASACPARYAMVAAVFLSIARRRRRGGADSTSDAAAPLVDRGSSRCCFSSKRVRADAGQPDVGRRGVATARRVEPAARAPAVYQQLATMPDATGRRRVPVRRSRLGAALRLLLDRPLEAARQRLQRRLSAAATRCGVARLQRVGERSRRGVARARATPARHTSIVHERALRRARPSREAWLDDHCAVEIARFDGDVLYDVTARLDR